MGASGHVGRRPLLAATLAGGCATVPDPLVLDDASGLNATGVARHVVLGPRDEAVALFRRELREARAAGRPVALGAARHSMGGQSLAPAGTAVTLAPAGCSPDPVAGTCRAGAGTRWRDVIAALDPLGLSPAVMQSNHDFGVASTFAVNAHGWPVPHGPFASTVNSLRLMLADGEVVTCSRTENAELFRLSAGGYGLVGIILDLDLRVVPNQWLTPSFARMPAAEFTPRFVALCTDPAVSMAYGRLNVAASDFLGEAAMIGYRAVPVPPGGLPAAGQGGGFSGLTRRVYRNQTGSEVGKNFRWRMEASLAPRLAAAETRNTLLNEPAALLAGTDPEVTDILHEYFLPPDSLAGFLEACRAVIPPSGQDLLNVTLRFVEPDGDSVLAFAPARRISAVMSFAQRRSAEADDAMRRMTQALIDRVLELGGSFYLPYRRHARRDQIARAYPRLPEFVAAKRRHDPGLLFRHGLWESFVA